MTPAEIEEYHMERLVKAQERQAAALEQIAASFKDLDSATLSSLIWNSIIEIRNSIQAAAGEIEMRARRR